MLKTPKDQAARDRIRQDLGSTLFVEAGAGTGKTTCLVDRLISLLTTHDPIHRTHIDELAAITFTEKAASELKTRLRRRLDALARQGGSGEKEAAEALKGLESAAIETIHAFAARILRACALEIGLPPAFEIRDDIGSQVAFDDWWEACLEDLLQNAELELVWEVFFESGLELKHLRQFAEKLNANCERIDAPLECAQPNLEEFQRDLGALASESCGVDDDKFEIQLRLLDPFPLMLSRAIDGRQPLALLDFIRRFNSLDLKTNAGRAASWRNSDLASLKARVKELQANGKWMEGSIRAGLATPMLELVRQAVVTYAERRRSEGTLEFQDLLTLAARSVRTASREQMQGMFKRILIDEFQDTDPLQLSLVEALAEGEEGRLFFVGDPRQSIYRFRRADVNLYRRRRQDVPEAQRLTLDSNFRSQETIIKWSNHVLGNLLKAAEQGLGGLDAATCTVGPKVKLLGSVLDERADAVREQEADTIAKAVCSLRSAGRSLADITILFPSRAILFFLERAFLNHGVPFRIESRSLLFETQEARDLFAILRAIEDPSDPIAIVAALKTPAFACSDQDLYDHVQAGNRFRYLQSVEELAVLEPETVVERGLAVLRGYHKARLDGPVSALAARITQERMLYELGLAANRPRDVWQRYTMVLDRIRAFDESTHGTLRQFLRWADGQIDRRASMNERIVSEEDDQSVRMMTIHAAKGLEFPVVFVAGLSGGDIFETGMRVTWDVDGRLHFLAKVGDVNVSNTGTKEAFNQDYDLTNIERNRVLYVACTRAKDELFVSQFYRQGSTDTAENLAPFKCLAKRIEECLAGAEVWCEPWIPTEFDQSPNLETWPDPPGSSRADWEEERRENFAKGREISIAATTVSKQFHDKEERDIEATESRPRGKGTNFGLAVHGALQLINLSTGEGLAEICRAQASAVGVGAREVEQAVRTALTSASVQAAAARTHFKEVFASAQIEGVLLEGIIDLLYEDEGELHVLDYKTNKDVSLSGRAEAMKTYRYQAGSYALILEQTTGKPVVAVDFVFLKGAENAVETIAGGALVEAKEDVRQYLRGLRGAEVV